MNRVLKEHARLQSEWAPEPVHNVRVALRRCILIADTMRDLDPGSDWKPMRKAGKLLFRRLGAVRDTQVLMELVERMVPPGDASAVPLLEELKAKCEKELAGAQEAAGRIRQKTMACLVSGSLWQIPPPGFRQACLRSYRAGNMGRRSGLAPPGAKKLQPRRLPPSPHRPQEVSIRRGKSASPDVPGLGARFEVSSGRVRRSP